MQLLISSVCMALTSAVIGNAYYQKKQFYPAVVYITKSNSSMAVIYIQFFVIVFMFGKLLRKIFLGTLRAAEFEHLLERFWYALTETCLAFTVFRDDFNPRFVALFTVLLFLKSFHWLAEERVDFMERSPVLGWLFHVRVASLLSMLGILDYILLIHAYSSTVSRGPSVQLVFGFEYAILLTVIASTAIKYILHAAEMRTDTPWENKAVFLLYTELVIGLVKVVLYLLFVVIMAKVYALPMFVFRPMFFTIRNFKKALNDVIMSRRAIRNMNTLYPDATPEELRLSDNICIICREDMINHSKKLPCGHIFHTTCLRSWFQRQQTCPTCRLNILRAPSANSTALPRQGDDLPAAVAGAAAAAAGPGIGVQGVPNAGAAAMGVGEVPGRVDTPGAVPPPFGYDLFADGGGQLPNFLAGGGNFPAMPMMAPMMPPFPFFAPYAVPPPPMPPDLTTFTNAELDALEGNLRKNVEERIKLLNNITIMLDSASILMNNYQMIAMRMQTAPQRVAPTSAAAAATASTSPPAATASTSPPAAAATTTTTNVQQTQTAATTTATTSSREYDRPTTSAEASAIAKFRESLISSKDDKSETTATAKATTSKAESASASSSSVDASTTMNKVTIEDLGADDDDGDDAAAFITSKSDVFDDHDCADSNELSELRKRRLKFLEERNNKSPTPSVD